jgi:hypothetical protein
MRVYELLDQTGTTPRRSGAVPIVPGQLDFARPRPAFAPIISAVLVYSITVEGCDRRRM